LIELHQKTFKTGPFQHFFCPSGQP